MTVPAEAAPAALPPAPAEREGRHPAAVPLLVGAVVSGLAAGGLYAVAAVQADRLEAGEVACADLDATRDRVNGLVLGSGGAALVAVGLGATGVVLLRW